VHDDAPADDVVPEGQVVHATAPYSAAYVPAEQGVHTMVSTMPTYWISTLTDLIYVPSSHLTQSLIPTPDEGGEIYPRGHFPHSK
jgi:hypothetical protein